MTFSVTILGSGAALPTTQRFPTSQVVQSGERLYMIDCAEGTQIQFRRYHLKFSQLRSVFISHLHGDHVFGLPGLLSTLSLSGRTEPMEIYGPPHLEGWLSGQMKYFTPLSFPVHFHTLTFAEPTVVYEDKQLTVTCFPLRHRIPTWGYLFREKEKLLNIRKEIIDFYHIPLREIPSIKSGADYQTEEGQIIANDRLTYPQVNPRSYAYCSDTVYLENLPDIVRNTDILYHESTYASDGNLRAKETFHSTAEDAAKIAKTAHAGKLVIGHFSSRYKDVDQLLREARDIFPNTEAAEDGKVFNVEQRKRQQ